MATNYRARITQLTPLGVMVEVTSLGIDYQFGPCQVVGNGYSVGQEVIVANVGDIKEDLIVIGPYTSDVYDDIVDGGAIDGSDEIEDSGFDYSDSPSLVTVWDSKPYIWAHRGGASVVPEQSLEGFDYAYNLGFPLEGDIQFLSDGTPVMCHDATTTRTMGNIPAGNVSDRTSVEWKKAYVKPVTVGGAPGRPAFFEECLDRWGGKILFVPELKTATTTTQAQMIIDMIKLRRLETSVILQSFNFDIAAFCASKGMRTLFLFGATTEYTPEQVSDAGIEFVGPSTAVTSATVSAFKSVGLKVVIYTSYTPADQAASLAKGADGVFTNDPLYTTGAIPVTSSFPVDKFKPAGTQYIQYSTSTTWGQLGLYPNGIGIYGTTGGAGGAKHITCPWAGKLTLPVTITGVFHYHPDSITSTGNFGITLLDRELADWVDGASPGQNGFTVAYRQRGDVDTWEYVDGAAAAAVISGDHTTATPFSELGNIGMVKFSVHIDASNMTVQWDRNGNTPKSATAAHHLPSTTKEYNLGLRFVGQTGHFTDLTVTRY